MLPLWLSEMWKDVLFNCIIILCYLRRNMVWKYNQHLKTVVQRIQSHVETLPRIWNTKWKTFMDFPFQDKYCSIHSFADCKNNQGHIQTAQFGFLSDLFCFVFLMKLFKLSFKIGSSEYNVRAWMWRWTCNLWGLDCNVKECRQRGFVQNFRMNQG